MADQQDARALTGAAVGIGAVVLCCALPALASAGALVLGLVFGIGAAGVVLAVAVFWLAARRRRSCDSAEPEIERRH